ncbi:MAG TPA: coproporphyrinogen III oxidase, partial [Blastocatellia bacterium]|nr:coproporphyrinogen III oxidase [Blastocatellia bacterium]
MVELMIEDQALIDKYNQPGPRYTSYPTAPAWDDNFGAAEFREALTRSNTKPGPPPLSLYFHIPFCDSLCLYCGCNVVINRNHDVAVSYVDHLKREVDWVSAEAAAG